MTATALAMSSLMTEGFTDLVIDNAPPVTGYSERKEDEFIDDR
jgi:hypothetical protein